MNRTLIRVFVGALSVAALSAPSRATTIVPIYANNVAGTWNSVEKGVIQEAINEWEADLPDDHTINVTFDFTYDTTSGYLAEWQGSSSVPTSMDSYPWTSGVTHTIHFNAYYFTGASYLWWDPNPTPPASYDGPSAAWDALSVARHELGHCLGFTAGFYYDNSVDKWTSHIAGSTFDPDGLNVSMAAGMSHVLDVGSTAGDLMVPVLYNGLRHGISTTDLSMLNLAYGYTVVPEPSALLLLAVGAFGVLVYLRGRRP